MVAAALSWHDIATLHLCLSTAPPNCLMPMHVCCSRCRSDKKSAPQSKQNGKAAASAAAGGSEDGPNDFKFGLVDVDNGESRRHRGGSRRQSVFESVTALSGASTA